MRALEEGLCLFEELAGAGSTRFWLRGQQLQRSGKVNAS